MELIAETINEHALDPEARPSDRMVEITNETELVTQLTARIEERYTTEHLSYFSITSVS